MEEETAESVTLETQIALPMKKKALTESSGVDMKGSANGPSKKMIKKNISCGVIASSVEVRRWLGLASSKTNAKLG